jgi:hypothetical protein
MAIVNPGLGTLLDYSLDGGTTYLPVAQRVTIDGPNIDVGEADTTTLDSTWKTNRPTLPDAGDLSLTCFYDPADTGHIAIFGMIGAAAKFWKLVFANVGPNKYVFNAWVKSFAVKGMDVEGNLTFELTLRLTGIITSP